MEPLFRAVNHGCAAGLHVQVWQEVFMPRIQRGKYFLWMQLGEYAENLSLLANFFQAPWKSIHPDINHVAKGFILNWAAYSLRANCRFNESIDMLNNAIESQLELKDWGSVNTNLDIKSDIEVAQGEITHGLSTSLESIKFADKSLIFEHMVLRRCGYAGIQYQAGNMDDAVRLFEEAEKLQGEKINHTPFLHGDKAYLYCQLLLDKKETKLVIKCAESSLKLMKGIGSIFNISLDKIILGQVAVQQGRTENAALIFEGALENLRASGRHDALPLGLLARAALFRHTHDFVRAYHDLQEVFDIAEPSGMRLHLTDYHLEMARLFLEESKTLMPTSDTQKVAAASSTPESTLTLQDHINQARALIMATGYHRRDAELAELEVENRFKEHASHGDKQRGFECLDKLKSNYGDTSSS